MPFYLLIPGRAGQFQQTARHSQCDPLIPDRGTHDHRRGTQIKLNATTPPLKDGGCCRAARSVFQKIIESPLPDFLNLHD
ncbi:hypothetical protein RG963_04385 [Methanosarcina sp. Z-7115]|uniref:Uncharacterized protein n=1 Tax=Methanosarcina baikalica TaxID=3073890 RepID=A0ABU2CZ84_9EURY|nr:hypothetical protein [Methanosarcina sp. Z-7115]MDR7665038.1 hypothetical protein [Methanosarcina sp. Z-7115]